MNKQQEILVRSLNEQTSFIDTYGKPAYATAIYLGMCLEHRNAIRVLDITLKYFIETYCPSNLDRWETILEVHKVESSEELVTLLNKYWYEESKSTQQ